MTCRTTVAAKKYVMAIHKAMTRKFPRQRKRKVSYNKQLQLKKTSAAVSHVNMSVNYQQELSRCPGPFFEFSVEVSLCQVLHQLILI